MKLHLFKLLVPIFSILILFPRPILAVSEFTSSYISTYTIKDDNVARVQHEISVTNNLAHIYLTRYTFTVSSSNIANLTVTDGVNPLPFNSQTTNGQTSLNIEFPHPVIGYNQSQHLTITYNSADLVESIGSTQIINIPHLAKSNEAKVYTRIVKVKKPASTPSHLIPPPSSTSVEDDYQVYTYTNNSSSALTLLFGDTVTYSLSLRYLLKNPELSSTVSELALPPDTPYQQMILDTLDPPPITIIIDPDGNYLARYNLKAQEKIWVTAKIYVTVSPLPIYPDPSSTNARVSVATPYWDIRALSITSLANQLKTPRNFYNYLTNNFHYNYDLAVNGSARLGATNALANPNQIVCTEFTDTFVSLARAVGISAREINGYAYSSNPQLRPLESSVDVLHSWPEYYDSESSRWVQLDPTWGATTGGVDYFQKLDFSHIAFVRHGLEPEYPLSPGMYKNSPDEKTLDITLSDTIPAKVEKYELKNNTLVNTGNVLLYHPDYGYVPPRGSATTTTSKPLSLYDKIKQLCVSLFSRFWVMRPGSL